MPFIFQKALFIPFTKQVFTLWLMPKPNIPRKWAGGVGNRNWILGYLYLKRKNVTIMLPTYALTLLDCLRMKNIHSVGLKIPVPMVLQQSLVTLLS